MPPPPDRRRALAELVQFLRMLAGNGHGLMEIRHRRPRGAMRQRFHPTTRLDVVAETILVLARQEDVYIGAAPRARRHGGRGAVRGSWVLWADLDDPAASLLLTRFRPAAGIVVASGSHGHRHAYWPLAAPLDSGRLELANRHLADLLGADPRATDAARILRPPHTLNHKHHPPAAVLLERLHERRHHPEDIVGALPTQPAAPPGSLRQVSRDPLMAIDPPTYVHLLTGQRVGRDGKITCPFHPDRTPSLHVYETPERGWYCYGCRRGRDVYDLAAGVWGLETVGADFPTLRRRLSTLFL